MKAVGIGLLLLVGTILAGCQPIEPGSPTLPTPCPTSGIVITFSPTQQTTNTPTEKIPAATPTSPPAQICSPLDEIPLVDLPAIVSNPFQAPRPGQDDGHHGTDFAFYSYQDLKSMLGLLVRSVMAGRVAAAINNRPPYGNMEIVETPLEMVSTEYLPLLIPPIPEPIPTATTALTCPVSAGKPSWDESRRSVYILYAHLENPPTQKMGEGVVCGQVLGRVGSTGASGNPHLHLEVRIGPSGATFNAMSHYNNEATPEEMSSYCTWRVSGIFQMVDPMRILLKVAE